MNQVKDILKATNKFKPNLSSLNHNASSLFGLIKLSEYCSNPNPFKSEILTDLEQYFDLIELCEFSPNDKWALLYRGTRDGFGSNDFHSRCDGHSNTLTILKAKESKFIFGGFTTVEWDISSEYKSDPNAFIFSLTNKENQPVIMKVNPNRYHNAIACDSGCGPIFGNDIVIENNANTTMNSFSGLGLAFPHPQYAQGTEEAVSFLAGTFKFQLDEIEVYQRKE
jgi:hypothetical protein